MGGITASNWKGRNVYKQKVPATNSSNSPAQAAQRSRFAVLATLARVLGPAIRVGFRDQAAKMTEQNVFTKRNSSVITTGLPPTEIQMQQLQVSAGVVAGVAGLAVAVLAGVAKFTWEDNSNGVDALPGDAFYVVIVSPNGVFHTAGFSAGAAAREEGQVSVALDAADVEQGGSFYAYAFFKRANSTAASPTAYAQFDL